jgi:hypothetical protein
MAEYLADQAEEHDLPVLIHGIAYKPGVPYLDGSYSLLVAHYLTELGRPPILVDPFTHPDTGPFTAVVLMAHSAETTYKYTNQNYADEMYCELLPGSVIIDPWRKFSKENNDYTVIHYGNTR